MDTATQEPTKPAERHESVDHAAVAPIDPEHDMDAKKTVLWLSVAMVFVIICMWSLLLFFNMSVAREQETKIEQGPRIELRALRSNEDYWIKKTIPLEAADKRELSEIERSIRESTESLIREYVRKQ